LEELIIYIYETRRLSIALQFVSVQQQFLVDRQGLQVFWPNSTPTLSKFDRMIGTASTTIAPSWS
jgi:hypothetical protein